jgi:hypothetical protein
MDVIEREFQITNMSQLGFDMTNLQAVDNNEPKIMFLSNSTSKSRVDFDASLDGLNVKTVDDYTYVGMNSNGAFVYENNDLSTSLTKTYIDGGMQILYEMKEKGSPKSFDLEIILNEGSRLEQTEAGEYVVFDSENEIEFLLGQAWAVDDNGDFVESYYEVSGNRISQIINYEGDNYPVKADPLFCTNTVDNGKTVWDSSYDGGRGTISVYPTTCAKVYLAALVLYGGSLLVISPTALIETSSVVADMYDELQSDSAYTSHVQSWQEGRIADQFVCHAFNPAVQVLQKYPWNLEPWRPDLNLAMTFYHWCNPPLN